MLRAPHSWFPRTAAGMAALGMHASMLVHLAAAGTILLVPWSRFWPDWDSDPVRLNGRQGVILIQAAFAEPEPPQDAVEIAALDAPVVVMPQEARIEQQRLVATPSTEAAFSQELAEIISSTTPAPSAPAAHPKSEPKTQPNVKHHAPRFPRAASAPPMIAGFEEGASFAGNAPPQYPSLASVNGWAGTVYLRLGVDATGQVTKVEVERSSGHAVLDASAVNAVRHWKGVPARRDGKPVATEEVLPVEFRLPVR